MKHLVTLLSILAIYACTPKTEAPTARIPPHPTATDLMAMMGAGETTSAKIVTELLRRVGEQVQHQCELRCTAAGRCGNRGRFKLSLH